MRNKIKRAFTLAEVLITLVVIGVISALTIPALITNIHDAQNKSAWKRAASDISQVSKKLALDNGGSLKGVFINDDDHNAVRDKLSNYFSYVKKCDTGTVPGPDGCWSSNMYKLSGTAFDYWDNVDITVWSRMVTNNGMFIATAVQSLDCTYDRAAKDNGCLFIGVDVNGFKKPNTVGKDIYWGYVTEDGGFEPFGRQGDYWTTFSQACCDLNVHADAYGFTCAAQYLRQ